MRRLLFKDYRAPCILLRATGRCDARPAAEDDGRRSSVSYNVNRGRLVYTHTRAPPSPASRTHIHKHTHTYTRRAPAGSGDTDRLRAPRKAHTTVAAADATHRARIKRRAHLHAAHRHRATSRAHTHTDRVNARRRPGIMPNGQTAGRDAVVERTAAAYRDRCSTTDTVASVTTDSVIAAAPPSAPATMARGSRSAVVPVIGVQVRCVVAAIRERPSQLPSRRWRLPRTVRRRCVRLRIRGHQAQEHRTYSIATCQTGTCAVFTVHIPPSLASVGRSRRNLQIPVSIPLQTSYTYYPCIINVIRVRRSCSS